MRWNKGQQFEANDFCDFNHVAAALGYCDAFLRRQDFAPGDGKEYISCCYQRLSRDRVAMLEAEVARVNLPADAARRWSTLIAEHGLSDAAVSDFSEDINTTAVAAAGAISGTLGQESVAFDVLVPTSITYYERLIGQCDEQKDIGAYADQVLPGFLGQLLDWNPEAGLRHALLLAAHPLVIERLAKFRIDKDVFTRSAKWAAGEGDVMARCAVLEMALMQSEVSDDGKRELDEIAQSLIVPDGQVDESFEMLSGVFVFVYGQLSHRKILADKPAFWRRMKCIDWPYGWVVGLAARSRLRKFTLKRHRIRLGNGCYLKAD